jgi:hypothetical protein
MDQELEDELLFHIAAGTDLPTTIAALPQDEASANKQHGSMMFILFAAALAGAWLLSR